MKLYCRNFYTDDNFSDKDLPKTISQESMSNYESVDYD